MTHPLFHNDTLARAMLRRAARLGSRGHGHVEPNPMVGCVLVDASGAVVGSGHHRRFGEAHAEVNALNAAGEAARGALAYVTLEPCAHTGKTPPCTQALIDAGVAGVIFGRSDPDPQAAGGAAVLEAAGIPARCLEIPECMALTQPWVHRLTTGLPWIVAKWAQTIDGCVATRTGASQWISGPVSRRMVHRERGRVDAILTGIGTVLADDPRLTARDVRIRRQARRIVIDPKLQTPMEAALVRSAKDVPTTICCIESLIDEDRSECRGFLDAGVELAGLPLSDSGDGEPLESALRLLAARHDLTTVLVESGGGLLGRLLAADLICEAWVFTAPMLLGDAEAVRAIRGLRVDALASARAGRTCGVHTRGDDVMVRYLLK